MCPLVRELEDLEEGMSIPKVLVDTQQYLLWYLDYIFLLIVLAKLRLLWCIKGVFRRLCHTNYVPVPPPVPKVGLGKSQ